MTDEDWRDKDNAQGASGGMARARRIQGLIEIAMSDLEREQDIGAAELAVHMLRTQMNRVLRLEGPEGYAGLIETALDVLAEQKQALTKTAAEDARRWAN